MTAGIEFDGGGAFYADLKRRVRAHLAEPGRERRAHRRMYIKSATMFAWAAISWGLLVFAATTWWQAGLLCVSLGLALAGIGMSVTHDANHGAFSPNRRVNTTMRWSLDLIGASSYVWRVKHNVVHHTYTNIAGADSDIEQLPLARLAPDQKRRWFHRFQHFYIWPLYGLFSVKWHTVGDLGLMLRGRIGMTPLRWPRGRELVGLVAGKVVFVSWTIVIPLLLHPAWWVALAFLATSFVLAFTIALIFQLAHCLEEADFSSVESMGAGGRTEWARHQVESTVNFAPRSRFLAWYLGGLNFQIEHHLFSRVCHIHYPGIAAVVRDACDAHGVRYQSHTTIWGAVASHTRWLKRMGSKSDAGRRIAVSPAG
jgi:linoleoyl-CoA desaturase